MSNADKPKKLSSLGLCIWGLAALFFLYEFFLRTFVGSLSHQIIADLRLNAGTFALLGSAYYAAYGLMQIPVGLLTDKFGVKSILLFASVVCTIATYFFAHADGFYSALISRVLMGFGSSFAFICLLIIVVNWLPAKYFGFFTGSSQFIGTMGPLLAGGPFILLIQHSHQSWRVTLTDVAFGGIILSVLIFFFVRNKPKTGRDALVLLRHSNKASPQLTTLSRNKQPWSIAIYSACVYVSLALLGAIWGTEYLQAIGYTQKVAASIVSSAWLGYAIACPMLGACSDISKRRKPILIGCALLGLVATSAITFLPQEYLTSMVVTASFFALGVAASGQNVGFAAIAEQSTASTRATFLGFNNGVISMFSTFVPLIASYFIYLSTFDQSTNLHPENFTLAFSLMPILYVISLVLACTGIQETYCRPQKETILLKR